MKRFVVLALLLGFVALPLFAQNPTGTLSGRVTDGKDALPGVTVTATSPNLQGTRTAVTSTNGDYIFRFLPPGEYKMKFELQGFTTLDQSIKISAGVSSKLDATMPQAKVAEEVTVTGTYETISTSSQASTTYEKTLIEKLPLGRDITNYVAMSPGVTAGVNGFQISGAQSYENLYLVNGVVVNENVRGQSTPLYIEDAIQETTTSTAAISAEYGRFAGGVVNTLTKSGGNELHGSYRLSMDNEKWQAPTPKTVSRLDKINKTHEMTLGGFFIKDRLWYFGAGRYRKDAGSAQTAITQIVFPTSLLDKRYELKLTGAITPNHRFVGSYINRQREWTGYWFTPIPIMDLESTYARQIPEALYAYNYTGVLSDNFFVEAQYSKRTLAFQNSGGIYTDLKRGTVVFDNGQYGYSYNSPIFCGICGPERRDNDDIVVKGSWFLSTAGAGSHDVVFGYDTFNDMRKSNNYQSGSNFNIYSDDTLVGPVAGGKAGLYPVILPESASYIEYYPIFNFSKGTNFKTNSIFLNDKWRLNNNLSFNIGLRYDKNDGKNAEGMKVSDDKNISPRLGLTWDPKGDGDITITAAYAKYVTAVANTVADSSSSAGSPAWFFYYYLGPSINENCNPATGANCLTSGDVIQKMFDWFCTQAKDPVACKANPASQALTVTDPNILVGVDIPGAATQIRTSLKSPNAQEYTAGISKRLGNAGMVRFDFVHREFKDFYITRVDASTGTVTSPSGLVSDLKLVENNNSVLSRKYDSIQTQFAYRILDTLSAGGSYTWSKLKGNVVGETTGSGPVAASVLEYPEYKKFAQNNPTGLLSTDQTHRARIYLVWEALNTKHNRLSVSLLQNYTSGTPYSANAAINIRPYVTLAPGQKPYTTAPSSVTYYFSGRDAYRTPTITRTDLSFNYSFILPAIGKDFEFFLIPQVTNVFNEQKLVGFNTTVYTSRNSGKGLKDFNPFTTAPVECPQGNTATQCAALGANWQKGPLWGQPTTTGSYQTPRTFSVSLGVRF